jgi:hypothetical protein
MKKYLSLLVLILNFSAFSQEKDLFLSKIVLTEKTAINDLLVEMKWDFSEFGNSIQGYSIEIIPIQDCWNRLDANLLNEQFNIVIDDKDLLFSDKLTLSFQKIKAKCFKYRIVDLSKKSYSNWSFYSFVKI